jgi:hypothetical protein
MGQIYPHLEKIGPLGLSGDAISIASSVLTLGGQQYQVPATNSAVLGTLTGSRTYFVYAAILNGVISTVISLNAPSFGLSGYQAYKLIGCFVTTVNGAGKILIPIDQLPRLGASVSSCSTVSMVNAVNGYLPIDGNIADMFGLIRNANGSYSNGNFSAINPAFINPIPYANCAAGLTVEWFLPIANASNTWSSSIYKNSTTFLASGSIDGSGSNGASTRSIQSTASTFQPSLLSVGDSIELRALNNLTTSTTQLMEGHVEFFGTVTPLNM